MKQLRILSYELLTDKSTYYTVEFLGHPLNCVGTPCVNINRGKYSKVESN